MLVQQAEILETGQGGSCPRPVPGSGCPFPAAPMSSMLDAFARLDTQEHPGYGPPDSMATYPGYAAAPTAYTPVAAAAPAADPYQHSAYAHPPPSYAPAPQYASYAPAYGAGANPDELRTVFITGFPADVKERELNNLLRFLPGYEVSVGTC